jgi:hypothetical protein
LTNSCRQIFEKLKGKIDPQEQEKKAKEFRERAEAQYTKQLQRDADVVSLAYFF